MKEKPPSNPSPSHYNEMKPTKSKTIEIRNLTDLRTFVEHHRPTIGELCEIIIGGLKYYPHPEDWTSCEDLLDELDHIEEHYLRLEEGIGIRQERPLFLDPGRVRTIRKMGFKEPIDPHLPRTEEDKYLWNAHIYDEYIGNHEFRDYPDPEKENHYKTNPILKDAGPGRYRDPSWPRSK